MSNYFNHSMVTNFLRYGIISIMIIILFIRLIRFIFEWFKLKSFIDKFDGVTFPLWQITLGHLYLILIKNSTKETLVDGKFLVFCFVSY